MLQLTALHGFDETHTPVTTAQGVDEKIVKELRKQIVLPNGSYYINYAQYLFRLAKICGKKFTLRPCSTVCEAWRSSALDIK